MNESPYAAELKAYQAFASLLAHAGEVESLFSAAKLEAPDPLKRLLGLSQPSSRNGTSLVEEPQVSFKRPEGVPDDWISIPVKESGVQGVVLAILRRSGTLAPGKITALASDIQPSITYGTVANAGSRAQGKTITRTNEGWALINASAAPIVENDRLWWSVPSFTSYELAAHRREIIRAILRRFPGGLMALQIVEQLKRESACKAPASKDLVRMDIDQMAEAGVIKRVGNTKKWAIAPA